MTLGLRVVEHCGQPRGREGGLHTWGRLCWTCLWPLTSVTVVAELLSFSWKCLMVTVTAQLQDLAQHVVCSLGVGGGWGGATPTLVLAGPEGMRSRCHDQVDRLGVGQAPAVTSCS